MPVQWIDVQNAEAYLRNTQRIDPTDEIVVRELSGGVSNVVLLVARRTGEPLLVLKQAREQLRVADPWFCSVERIWREVEVLEICERSLSHIAANHTAQRTIAVPRVLFCDRDNYLYAMTAAPRHVVWKQMLLDGACDDSTATAAGELLGTIHGATWNNPEVARQLDDRTFFDHLRIDPYYRHVARHHERLAPSLERLEQSLWQHRQCLVHGDFSPKNLLVYDGGLMLVDFEVGHYGDPAFDIGFFLAHLILKAFRAGNRAGEYLRLIGGWWDSYRSILEPTIGSRDYAQLVERGLWNLAGCMLARIDGKSKVDYLDEPTRIAVRTIAQKAVCEPPKSWREFEDRTELAVGR